MAKVFGIDLGTTYSCIAFVNDYGKAEVVNNQDSSPITPSVVAFEEGGNVSVGNAAKETLKSDPDNVCTTIKRQMGKRDYTFNAFGNEYTHEAISALILQKVTNDASQILGEEVKNVVITCPAYFGLSEREATKNAGEIAGLNVLGILNEPTAAAISYGMQVDTPQTVMVYDLGGGTFDVTVIKVENGTIQVVATGGDHMLGGKDWDNTIREYVVNTYCEQTGESSDSIYDDNETMGDLELNAENAKKQLTQREKAVIKLNRKQVEISRELFDSNTATLLESTITKTRETMDEAAKKGVTKYDKILLVGGSTRMPQVQNRLKQEFPDIPVEFCDPDQSVAKGAAIYGINMAAFSQTESGESVVSSEEKEELKNNPLFKIGGSANAGSKPITIVNVLSQCVAIRLFCQDGTERIVNQIYKNTAVPYEHELHAGTVDDNQETVHLSLYENASTDEYVEESLCKLLVEGDLGPLPPNLPANEPIDVVFKIDANGLLSVDAEHKPSGKTTHIEVQLQDALTETQLEEEKKKVTGLRVQ